MGLHDGLILIDLNIFHVLRILRNLLLHIQFHNLFLNYAAEMGFVAPLLILLFFLFYIKDFLFIWNKKVAIGTFDYGIIMGSTAMLLGNFVHSFFDTATNFFNFATAFPFILITSMGIATLYKQTAVIKLDSKY